MVIYNNTIFFSICVNFFIIIRNENSKKAELNRMKILKSFPVTCMMILQNNKRNEKESFEGTCHDRLRYDNFSISTVFYL